MPLRHMLFLAFVAIVGLTACGRRQAHAPLVPEPNPVVLRESGPAHFTDWLHSPLRAADHEAITFRVAAKSDVGIARVELYVYEYELMLNKAGLPSQRRREDGVWGRIADFAQPFGKTQIDIHHRHAAGFGRQTRLEYVWRVTDSEGEITERLGLTDAGSSAWPQDKVLLFASSRAPMSDLIDIAFFRDTDYADDRDRYNSDVEAMVTQGFFGSEVFSQNRQVWAFYTTDRSADGAALSHDITNDALLPSFLKDFSIPGIDAFCLLHRNEYTDRSLLLENFHSLSNNLFSAEAHNWGTAVHECGHAIFHLSDEYDGCACFQTHSESNVFRERGDCVSWNLSNGFPATDCYELADVYSRSWWSAEEPTFFENAEACRVHNRKQGLNPDSCRTFVDEAGKEKYWSFESTCIMHDDGDHEVRPFQRACRQVIEAHFTTLRRRPLQRGMAELGSPYRENIYGYEPVLALEMQRKGQEWNLEVIGVSMGVPTADHQAAGEVRMRVVDANGQSLASYQLANAGAVHQHGSTDRFTVPEEGVVRIAVPASANIERVICEYDRTAHARSADAPPADYAEGYVFEIGNQTRALLKAAKPK